MMKIRRTTLLTIGLLLLILASCKKTDDCDSVLPTCSCAYIGIVDSEGNSLLGPANVYKPAEITLSREGQIIELTTTDLGGEDLYLNLFFSEMLSGEDYLLQLNDMETEILNLEIIENKGPCFTTYTIQKFSLNGIEIMEDAERYLIEK